MEPRNDASKETPEQIKVARNTRFQIEKLEERIAPRHSRGRGGYHYQGRCYNPTTRDGC